MMSNGNASDQLEHYGTTSKLILAFAICALTLVPAGTASAKKKTFPPPFAITKSGPVLGMTVNGVNEFLGIPYAKPPVGQLRWMPPQAFGKFKAPLQATSFGNICTQGGSGSEDCLFLNVYTPNAALGGSCETCGSGKPGGGLPVMVWIHGGGLTGGAGSLYDPTQLVTQGGVIVVTINYRLGLLGFFAQSGLDAEHHMLGNYGFMDQQLALKWVKQNIKAFGGNPKEVTIFGESAGGNSVYSQLASPLAKGLFRAAIAESGSYVEFQPYFNFVVPLQTAAAVGTGLVPAGDTLATDVGCSDETAACLRGVSAADMVAVQPGVLYGFVDGKLLTQSPTAAFESGQFNQVPVMAGTNHDEYRLFVAEQYDGTGNPIDTSDEYTAAVTALWTSQLASHVLTAYPYADYANGGLALSASGTDGVFSCPARNADKSLSKFVTTYAYEFNDENAPPGTVPGLSFPLGAFHGAEVLYLFKVTGDMFPFTTDQMTLSATMIGYWTQFAKTLDPNSSGAPMWSPYSSAADQFQSLVPPTPMPETNFNTFHMCDELWNTF